MYKKYFYKAFCLDFLSDFLLPGVPPGAPEPDVVIRQDRLQNVTLEREGCPYWFRVGADGVYIYSDEIGTFFVGRGREVIVDPTPGVAREKLRESILCGIMGLLLHQRGILALHGSAVCMNGVAVGFIGEQGCGKSTIVAALYARGHRLVTDDLMAIDTRDGIPHVLPGIPQLKLWPDSASSLRGSHRDLPRIFPDSEKRVCPIADRFSTSPVPLKMIYVLKEAQRRPIETLRPKDAMLELIPHWYNNRFGLQLVRRIGIDQHFLHCATVANRAPACLLKRGNSLANLPEICAEIEKHIG